MELSMRFNKFDALKMQVLLVIKALILILLRHFFQFFMCKTLQMVIASIVPLDIVHGTLQDKYLAEVSYFNKFKEWH